MKKILFTFLFVFALVQQGSAGQQFHIEVLQVSNIELFDMTYNGFLEELAKHGIIEGENLTVSRHVIDADADASLWEKVGILFKIKNAASAIVDAKPDLVFTISTPATKYSRKKIVDAGIPLVFSAVANPVVVGCKSQEVPDVGFTGATLYLDPLALLTLSQMAVPGIKLMGMIHSDDDNAIAFAEESQRKAPQLGFTIVTKQIRKSDPVKPAAAELLAAGIDSIGVPLDTYYGLKDSLAGKEILDFARENNMPLFAYMNYPIAGAVLYIGPDFKYVGGLSGKQAAQILLEGKKPEDLPILKQEELFVFTDPATVERLGLTFPEALTNIAKPAKFVR